MKCDDEEWQHCRVEKMGCSGCYYEKNSKDEMSEKEVIKQLKKILKIRKKQQEIIEHAGGYCENCNPDIKAIETILDLYNKEKEKNLIFKGATIICNMQDDGIEINMNANKLVDEYLQEKVKSSELEELLENSISKDKIRAKIDKLYNKEKQLQDSVSKEEREQYSDAMISYELMDIAIRTEELQDLLEEQEQPTVGIDFGSGESKQVENHIPYID